MATSDLSVNDARRLIETDPPTLFAAVRAGAFSPGTLTHVAEEMGRDCPGAQEVLWELLDHERPIVREGAVYGMSHCIAADKAGADRFLAKLIEMKAHDPSPGVRSAVIDEIEMMEAGNGDDD